VPTLGEVVVVRNVVVRNVRLSTLGGGSSLRNIVVVNRWVLSSLSKMVVTRSVR
jgi:hypothetical protein